jgi:hypothetical protein
MRRYFVELSRKRESFLFSALVVEAPNKKTAQQIVMAYLDANHPGPGQYSRWHLGEDAYGLRWHEESFHFDDARINAAEAYDHEEHGGQEIVQIVEGKAVEFDPDG